MAVLIRQFNDGKRSGKDRPIFPPHDAPHEPELMTLTRKAESAARNGWTVTWSSPFAFTAVKEYDYGPRRHVRRQFWIV